MTRIPTSPQHPGDSIKKLINTLGLSITRAAELLGVGRPALSNLLNEKVALTPEMAKRIEKALGGDAQALLALQAAHDEHHHREVAKEIAVRSYVPKFLEITARQISAWAGQSDNRAVLAALLRRLVHSTGTGITAVNFPAFDNAQSAGWDGFIEADEATPWVPRGKSGWEFGCTPNAKKKADADYEVRTNSVAADERASTVFIFVSPHRWPAKDTWAKAKRERGDWKDVRAYDGNDLEQWLEQSVATQCWLGERIGTDLIGLTSLESSWDEWASAAVPSLDKKLFSGAVEVAARDFGAWLTQPPRTPFVIAADSKGEGLAFVACALAAYGKPPGAFLDRAMVFKTEAALRKITAGTKNLIVVTSSPEVEAAAAGIQESHYLIIIRRRNDVSGEPNLVLDPVDDKSYRAALNAMGLPDEDYSRYARDTAYSPTILRRYLSKIPAVREPAWATNNSVARDLIPLNFAGVWNSDTPGDQEILRLLTGKDYSEVELKVSELCTEAEAPVWSIGRFRGVTSKLDILFATHNLVVKEDIETFLLVGEYVLSEKDPAIDLPMERQWAAHIYGKTREHSGALRESICESLVLLAAHGNHLFQSRIGIDVQRKVDALIKRLLTPLGAEVWASQKGELPHYAEAAPNIFLDVLEEDLRSPAPKVNVLLQPADSLPFGGCPRTGLIWALETLAWNPERLLRVCSVLAELCRVPINDNWVNKPENSLHQIFRSWMPQTSASVSQRNEILEIICRRYPEVGWKICIDEFGRESGIGHYSARPKWRNEASGSGQPVDTWDEILPVQDKAREIALAWPNHDDQTLGDLVERLQAMPEEDREKVWALVRAWAATQAGDLARHKLRERIRQTAFTRRARIRGVAGSMKDSARQAYELLAPRDLVVRNLWLFARHWVDESADELEDEDLNYEKRELRILALRKEALREIWSSDGYQGVLRLSDLGDADSAIGSALADGAIPELEWFNLLDHLAGQTEQANPRKIDLMISGFLSRLDDAHRETLLHQLLQNYLASNAEDKAVRILKCAPFLQHTWTIVRELPDSWQARYWSEAYVWVGRLSDTEINYLIDQLWAVGRSRAAFNAVHLDFGKVEPERLVKLLRGIATSDAEPSEQFHLAQHEISEAFKSLSKRNVPRNELMQLEFQYVQALEHTDYGIPSIQAVLSEDPALFVQLIGMVYRRVDDGQDPPEWDFGTEERRRAAAMTAYTILRLVTRTPGTNKEGVVKPEELRRWVDEARRLGTFFGRQVMTDQVIGEILSRSTPGPNGVWPSDAVKQVFDAVASEEMARGLSVGRYNLRGVHWRGPNGNQERDIAAQYRSWSKIAEYQYPFMARVLEQIAQTYDREAVMHDTESMVRKRISH